jgi:hypothetical protein
MPYLGRSWPTLPRLSWRLPWPYEQKGLGNGRWRWAHGSSGKPAHKAADGKRAVGAMAVGLVFKLQPCHPRVQFR